MIHHIVFYVFLGMVLHAFNERYIKIDIKNGIAKSVTTVFLPALILKSFLSLHINHLGLIPPLFLANLGCCLAMAIWVYRHFAVSHQQFGVLVLCCCFGNVTYLGIVMLNSLFPTENIAVLTQIATMCEVVVTPCMLIVSSILSSLATQDSFGMKLKKSGLEIVKLTALWAVLFALLIQFILNTLHLTVDPSVMTGLTSLSLPTAPLMMILLGMYLQPNILRQFSLSKIKLILPAMVIKLLISPLILITLIWITGVRFAFLPELIIESAMPPQLLLFFAAQRFRFDTELLAIIVMVSTLLSLLTIPLLSRCLAIIAY